MDICFSGHDSAGAGTVDERRRQAFYPPPPLTERPGLCDHDNELAEVLCARIRTDDHRQIPRLAVHAATFSLSSSAVSSAIRTSLDRSTRSRPTFHASYWAGARFPHSSISCTRLLVGKLPRPFVMREKCPLSIPNLSPMASADMPDRLMHRFRASSSDLHALMNSSGTSCGPFTTATKGISRCGWLFMVAVG